MDEKNKEYRKLVKERHGNKYKVIGEFETKYRKGSLIEHTCKEHGSYFSQPFCHTKKYGGCPECNRLLSGFVKNLKEYKDYLKKYHPTIKCLEIEFKGVHVKSKHRCKIHGEFLAFPVKAIFKEGARNKMCPLCGERKRRNEMEYTIEQYNKDIKKKFGSKIKFIGKKLNPSTKVPQLHYCSKHGNFKIKPEYLLSNKYGCPKCAKEERAIANKDTFETFLQKFKDKGLDKKIKILSKSYRDTNTKMNCICLEHNKRFKCSANALLQGDTTCPDCKDYSYVKRGLKHRKTTEQYQLELDNKYNKTIKVKKEYKGANKHILHECLICNFSWKDTPTYLISCSKGCPKCTHKKVVAKPVKLGSTLVRVQGNEPQAIKYLLKTYKPSDIKVQSTKEIPKIKYKYNGKERTHYPDIYIPKENKLIEVKSLFTFGLTHYDVYGRSRAYTFNCIKAKAKAALKQGFNYEVMIIEDIAPIELPRNWYELSYREVKRYINS